MSVEEVLKEFAIIIKKVYKRDSLTPGERTQQLRDCMENIMKKKEIPVDTELMGDAQAGRCRW